MEKNKKKTAAIITLGCKVNQYETNAMSQKLLENGYEVVEHNQKADVYIINTCTVTNMSDRKSRQMIRKAKEMNPQAKVIAVGCYVQVAKKEVEKIEKINQTIADINNNLDKMYMDKLKGILQEEDYIRVAQKLGSERVKLNEKKQELEQKLIGVEDKIENKKQKEDEKELDKLIEDFLKFEKIGKIYLYRLINKIEIDKDKNIYIYFNFSKLNSINQKLEEFIKIEEILNKKNYETGKKKNKLLKKS